ncbi:phage tail protein [Alloscardovia macacae]|uniref:Tape measure domain-containing protein n=1 Tax=Alloscardovia macacae TaxID=1160091 RepID=A0A261F2G0_9BIFI|nr:tape measure protein [Alloscardovia macacae]OZG53106.1 tape measure domain-containing protein [Alloscardovia macacae]
MAKKGTRIATAYLQIVPTMSGVGAAIRKAFAGKSTAPAKEAGGQAGAHFAGGLRASGAIIGAAAAVTQRAMSVISGSIGSAISRADMMNNFPKIMANMGYSSEQAAAAIKKISSSLDGLPTSSSAIAGMVQQLAPLTSNLDEATNISLALNNALLAGGKSTVEQSNALMQYTQMLAVGKVDMQAWRSVQSAMPMQLNQMAVALLGAGKNSNDLYQAMKKGKVSFEDFNNTLVKLNAEGIDGFANFETQARSATQGIGTAMENVQNRVAKAVQKVIEAIGVENISVAINSFSAQFGGWGDAVAGAVQKVKEYLIGLWTELDKNGSLTTFTQAWDQVVAALAKAAQQVIDWAKLIPPETAANAIKKVAEALQWIMDNGQTIGPIVQSMAAGFIAVKIALTAYEVAVRLASVAQAAFNAIMAINPVTAIIVAIIALVAGLTWFFTQTELGRTIWQNFMNFLSDTWTAIQNGFNAFIQAASAGWNVVMSVFAQVGAFIASIVNAIIATFTPVVSAFADMVSAFVSLITGMMSGIANFLLSIISAIQSFFSPVTNFVMGVLGVIAAFVVGWATALWNVLTTIFTTAWNNIVIVFTTIWNVLVATFQAVGAVFTAVFTGLWNILVTVFTTMWQNIQIVFHTVLDALTSVFTFFANVFRGKWQQAWQALTQVFTTMWNGLTSILRNSVNGIGNVLGNVKNIIMSVFSGAGNWLVSIGKNIIDGLTNGIKNAFNGVKNVINTLASWIPDTIKGLLGIHSPSRVMRDEIGRWIPAGLAQGIKNAAPLVDDAMSALTDRVSGAKFQTSFDYTDNLNPIGALSGRYDVSMTDSRLSQQAQLARLIGLLEEHLPKIEDGQETNMSKRDFKRLATTL